MNRVKSKSRQKRAAGTELPFVLVNMAMTADGKIATANRAVSSFGSPRDHAHLLALRATADAVLAGARTVDSADVNLGPGGETYKKLRRRLGLAENNLRVIVSRTASINPNAAIFKQTFSPIIILTTQSAPRARRERLKSLGAHVKVCGRTSIHFRRAFVWLKQRWGVRRLLCEGGGELNDALFRAGLVDELNLTICPFVFGGRTAPTIADGEGAASLAQAVPLVLKERRRRSDELFLRFERPRPRR